MKKLKYQDLELIVVLSVSVILEASIIYNMVLDKVWTW